MQHINTALPCLAKNHRSNINQCFSISEHSHHNHVLTADQHHSPYIHNTTRLRLPRLPRPRTMSSSSSSYDYYHRKRYNAPSHRTPRYHTPSYRTSSMQQDQFQQAQAAQAQADQAEQQNPNMQNSFMPNPSMQNAGMPGPFPQNPSMQNPGMPNPYMQNPGIPGPFPQNPGMSSTFSQIPSYGTSDTQLTRDGDFFHGDERYNIHDLHRMIDADPRMGGGRRGMHGPGAPPPVNRNGNAFMAMNGVYGPHNAPPRVLGPNGRPMVPNMRYRRGGMVQRG